MAYSFQFRNTPLLVQIFAMFFGLPSRGVKLDVILVATIALAVNLGAYAAEIIRAGLESIPKSQIEAGTSLSMTRVQVFRHVVLMPALKNVYPSLTSQFVLLMLATSVVSQIAAPELFYEGSIIQSRTYRDFEVYIVIAVLYLPIISPALRPPEQRIALDVGGGLAGFLHAFLVTQSRVLDASEREGAPTRATANFANRRNHWGRNASSENSSFTTSPRR